jgi:GntR family transcriptional regulator
MAIIEAEGFPFAVDQESGSPIWVQLRKRIVFLISTGYLKPGDQLPKVRELAVALSINFNTVNKAYLSLASDGYANSIRGKGVFINEVANAAGQEGQGELEAVLEDCLQACKNMGLTYDETIAQMTLYVQRLKMKEAGAYIAPGGNVLDLKPQGAAAKRRAN